MLVLTDEACKPCHALMPSLSSFARMVPFVRIVNVHRSSESDSVIRWDSIRILIQNHWEVSKAYGIFLTPSAFYVNAEGVIAANVAVGALEILNLVRGVGIMQLVDWEPIPFEELPQSASSAR